METPRLAVLSVFPEEDWPSIDLVAEMLLRELGELRPARVVATRACPRFLPGLTRLPFARHSRRARNVDRLVNRFWVYPRHLEALRRLHDYFYLPDHSYAQLVHALPAERTGVFCQDLDTFRCLLEPARDPRPRWFRAMTGRILSGLQRAKVVFHSSLAVRHEIERFGLIDPTRLVHAPLGIAAEFSPGPPGEETAPYLLHVGSCIPRKRIDVLLEVFAGLRASRADLRLVKVGGPWAAAHEETIRRLGLESAITLRSGLERSRLADLYRGAALVLQPSEAEGFGLPIVEALACGAVVLASDLPVHRETGGAAAVYCAVGDVPAWIERAEALLRDPAAAPGRDARLEHARRFTWASHAEVVVDALVPGAP